ncbi:unnamed protein product [Symbiodinium natans]|uniref:Uncharacterized protein n=1 Tax=Symbiodinium natans TaxID=878477 RepID=A0A812V0S0_9DINO|nr:unnamed protein product [Symbiodinium natans]
MIFTEDMGLSQARRQKRVTDKNALSVREFRGCDSSVVSLLSVVRMRQASSFSTGVHLAPSRRSPSKPRCQPPKSAWMLGPQHGPLAAAGVHAQEEPAMDAWILQGDGRTRSSPSLQSCNLILM